MQSDNGTRADGEQIPRWVDTLPEKQRETIGWKVTVNKSGIFAVSLDRGISGVAEGDVDRIGTLLLEETLQMALAGWRKAQRTKELV